VISDNPRPIIIIVIIIIKHSVPAKLSMLPNLTFDVLTNQLCFTYLEKQISPSSSSIHSFSLPASFLHREGQWRGEQRL